MGQSSAPHADIQAMTFEQALKELEQIVGKLERGDVELEPSSAYERASPARPLRKAAAADRGQGRENNAGCSRHSSGSLPLTPPSDIWSQIVTFTRGLARNSINLAINRKGV